MLVLALTDKGSKLDDIRAALSPTHVVHPLLDSTRSDVLENAFAILVDVELQDFRNIERLQRHDKTLKKVKRRIFLVDKKSHLAIAQAYSLGATDVADDALSVKDMTRGAASTINGGEGGKYPKLSISSAALASLFGSMARGSLIEVSDAVLCTDAVMSAIQSRGLTDWLDRVWTHHQGTFQHCLLVTGIAIDFAICLGFGDADIWRLGLAATLHDIGKASIPRRILDKPGRLDAEERAIIEQHPDLGCNALKGVENIEPELLFAVRHHHEFLDGSGYPERLRGAQIPDLVRMLTIADIFSALIEYRSYKPPMPRHQAYDIICDMQGKLELPLIRAFRDVALVR
jgi:putative nucleotidyltransferase with HDIG domain